MHSAVAVPAEREMPPAAREAQKRLLFTAIAAEADDQRASIGERMHLRLRHILGLLGLLLLACAVVGAACAIAASGSSHTRHVAELTVATSASAAALSLPALKSHGTGLTPAWLRQIAA